MEFNFYFCTSLYLKSHIHPLELDKKERKKERKELRKEYAMA